MPDPIQTPPPNLLRIQSVMARTGITSKSTLYYLIKKNRFPKPLKISFRSSAWREDSINDWIDDRIAAAKEA